MSYIQQRGGRIFVVRWDRVANETTLAGLATALRTAARAVGLPLAFVNVIPEHLPPASADERRAIQSFSERTASLLASTDVVFEGDSPRHALARVMLRTFYALRRSGPPVYCHTSLTEAAARLLAQRRDSPKDLELLDPARWPDVRGARRASRS